MDSSGPKMDSSSPKNGLFLSKNGPKINSSSSKWTLLVPKGTLLVPKWSQNGLFQSKNGFFWSQNSPTSVPLKSQSSISDVFGKDIFSQTFLSERIFLHRIPFFSKFDYKNMKTKYHFFPLF